MNKFKDRIFENIVVITFALLCVVAYIVAKQNPLVVVMDLVSRVMRNSILVLALIIPIMAGMGLNFSIAVGAMAAQSAIIIVTHMRLGGLSGIGMSLLIATVISVFCGYLLGLLFNNTKGQEMITGMIAGYFGQGIYLLIFLVLVGSVIPFWDEAISIKTGIGVKDTLNMTKDLTGAMDKICSTTLANVLLFLLAVYCIYKIWSFRKKQQAAAAVGEEAQGWKTWFFAEWVIAAGLLLLCALHPACKKMTGMCRVPIGTFSFILLVSLFTQYVTGTKLGQDLRSVGNDMRIAQAAGINVARVRIIATICSTVLAAWGQFVFLQNMGTFSTYTAQNNVGTYSIAALLVGGATIDKANIKQAFIGVVLFQLLFLLAPSAGMNLFHSSQIGEYFRSVLSNGIIAVALVLHALKTLQAKKTA